MNTHSIRVLGCSLALAVAAGLAGCGGKDAASYLASAKSYIAKSDYKAAIIEIKNALQKEPENGEARLLLAQSLLETGDPAGAETEARKAIAAGSAGDRTYPLLAQTLIAQGKFATVTTELGTRKLDGAEARADLAVALATAQAAQGDLKGARSALDGVLAEQPNNVRALLLEAQFAGRSGDLQAAHKYVDAALKSSPTDANALLMNAELALVERRRDDAQKLMEQAIDANPSSLAARAALVSLAVTGRKLDIAKAQLAKMKEIQPRDSRTVYSDALVGFAEGDSARARQAVQGLLAVRPDHLPSLLLSGLIDYQTGSYASAEETLRKVLARVPGESVSRRILASIYLRSGRAPQALDALGPALRASPDDPALLRLAGEAYLASGNPELAADTYERANAIDKGNIGSQVRLAQVRFAAGDTKRAFNDLEALSDADSSASQADLALFAAHLKRREFDQALAVADKLETKAPKSPLPSNLRGIVYMAKRDLKSARASFEKALEIQPDFYAAATSLATIDIQEGNVQAARDRYDKLLAKNPKNEQLLLASAEVLRMSGAKPEEIRGVLDRAVSANPASPRARLARIVYDVRRRDAKAALATAQTAVTAIPNDPQLMDMLATVQLMNGQTNEAVDTLKRVVAMQPQNPLALLRLAEMQRAVKDYPAALDSARKALALKPDLSQAWGTTVKIHVMSGHPEAAIAEARKLQKEQPDKALGYALEGETLVAQKKWADAAVAFRAALKRQPVPVLAARLYVVLQAAGKQSEATAMANQWMKDNPKDATLPQLMAQQHQQRKEYVAAVDGYKRVLEIDPNNVVALNNLAWVLTEQNDPKGVEYAEQAHRLAPFNPKVLDTLGWALARTGEPKRGVQLLRMASALAPGQSEIRLHLGKALINSGDKAGAKQTLADLAKLDKNSPIRIEAEKLLATL